MNKAIDDWNVSSGDSRLYHILHGFDRGIKVFPWCVDAKPMHACLEALPLDNRSVAALPMAANINLANSIGQISTLTLDQSAPAHAANCHLNHSAHTRPELRRPTAANACNWPGLAFFVCPPPLLLLLFVFLSLLSVNARRRPL